MMADTSAGEYYLTGVREMASGFLVKPDNTFQFFFAYGALDRQGAGKWRVEGDSIFFTTEKWQGKDFSFGTSKKTSENFINISINHTNPMLLSHIWCSLQNGEKGTWQQFDQRGTIQFPIQQVTTIALQFEFCPERFTVIPIAEKEHNDFVFQVEPSLVEIYLNNFSLQIDSSGLKGRHPLLEGGDFKYGKQ